MQIRHHLLAAAHHYELQASLPAQKPLSARPAAMPPRKRKASENEARDGAAAAAEPAPKQQQAQAKASTSRKRKPDGQAKAKAGDDEEGAPSTSGTTGLWLM